MVMEIKTQFNPNLVNQVLKKQWRHYWNQELHQACLQGDLCLFEKAVTKGADLFSDSTIYFACQGGHWAILQALLDRGFDDWIKGLYRAVETGKLAWVKFLLSKLSQPL